MPATRVLQLLQSVSFCIVNLLAMAIACLDEGFSSIFEAAKWYVVRKAPHPVKDMSQLPYECDSLCWAVHFKGTLRYGLGACRHAGFGTVRPDFARAKPQLPQAEAEQKIKTPESGVQPIQHHPPPESLCQGVHNLGVLPKKRHPTDY